MKVAVTLASGQLGSAIIKALIAKIGKNQVLGIARTPEKAEHLGIEIRKGDYNNRSDFDVALQGVDQLVIVSGMDDPQRRIQQHRNVIEAAKQNGVKKIIYTSIIGDEEGTGFNPVVKSNRQTEEDVQSSGLEWVIGRNGIYIEPDLEYLDNYIQAGKISNCAGNGKVGYTSRAELAMAYANMLLEEKHNGQTYNLNGQAITQSQLADYINQAFGTNLTFKDLSVTDYQKERQAALGDFLGTIIAGIYEGIRKGVNEVPSDFEKAAGRPHLSPLEMMKHFQQN
ncbi:SDR family oxidoreductase [Persicobacter diffluens]|uniref:NAD(P)-dependent oxidoreductase n=1 Tax=Persicobacter diffluens TaxID=981 RepID=A0AAN4W021_9BACT|nr:NAD(P)-dependent oxidoreductase [Persicobacter diffluens]